MNERRLAVGDKTCSVQLSRKIGCNLTLPTCGCKSMCVCVRKQRASCKQNCVKGRQTCGRVVVDKKTQNQATYESVSLYASTCSYVPDIRTHMHTYVYVFGQ